jgi:hypothetical protein
MYDQMKFSSHFFMPFDLINGTSILVQYRCHGSESKNGFVGAKAGSTVFGGRGTRRTAGGFLTGRT